MKLTNMEFSKENKLFREACKAADIPATGRQASKFRRQKGLAHRYQGKAQSAIDKKQNQDKEQDQKQESSARI